MSRTSEEGPGPSGLLRVLQTREETRAFYNKIAAVYDVLAERSEEAVRKRGIEMLDVRPGERVLEVGSGTGHTLAELAEAAGPSGAVYGIDLADEMVRMAGRLLEERGLAGRVHLTRGDALELPYESGSMDAAFMSFALELFDTPEIPRVLAECRRVLRAGGRLVDVSISRVQPDGLATRVYEWSHRHFPNLLDCRPIMVRRALEEAGFEIRDAAVQMMWVPVEIVLGVRP